VDWLHGGTDQETTPGIGIIELKRKQKWKKRVGGEEVTSRLIVWFCSKKALNAGKGQVHRNKRSGGESKKGFITEDCFLVPERCPTREGHLSDQKSLEDD